MFIPDQDSFRFTPYVRCAHLLSAAIQNCLLTPGQRDVLASKVRTDDMECASWPELFRLKIFIADHYVNSIPNASADNPAAARLRGFMHRGSEVFIRRPSLAPVISRLVKREPNTRVVFRSSPEVCQPAYYALIPVECLQPSHTDWLPNPDFFLADAQPKDRFVPRYQDSAEKLAKEIDPWRLFDSYGVDKGGAYSGAPVVNIRGEVIQGNTRAAMLRIVFKSLPDKARYYTQCLREWWAWCTDKGLLKDVTLQVPDGHVLVRVLCEPDGSDIPDEKAIALGQYVETHRTPITEQFFNTDNALRQIIAANKLKQFTDVTLATNEEDDDDFDVEEEDLDSIIGKNYEQAIRWLRANQFISADEYLTCCYYKRKSSAQCLFASMFERLLLAGCRDDARRSIAYLPGSVELALSSVIYRDFDMPAEKRLLPYFQRAFEAYSEIREAGVFCIQNLSQYDEADRLDAVLSAIRTWAKQPCQTDFGKIRNGDGYSDFVLYLAAAFRAKTHEHLIADLTRIYDLMTGQTVGNIFNNLMPEPPIPLPEAVRIVTGQSLFQREPRLIAVSNNPNDDPAELDNLLRQIEDLIATRFDHREPLPLVTFSVQRVEALAARFNSSIIPQIEYYPADDLRTILCALRAYASFRYSLPQHPELLG